jgi:alcohol dehydrogenase YqhD (iron-dependent ADH family)
MNAASVLTNAATKEKYSARSPHLYPRSAFLDPELTLTVPIGYTAFACTDILAHMMEGYLSTTAGWSPVQDGLAEGLCRSVIQSMERLMVDPRDYNARSALMWAGALAWSGLVNAGLEGAQIPNHMLEHPLSAHFGITHGAGLSILIPAWMEYKKDSIGRRIVQFGDRILGLGSRLAGLPPAAQADLVIAELKAWYRKIGTPVSLAEAGILNPDLGPLADQAMRLAGLWGVKGYTREDAIRIYKMCS